MNIGCRVAAWLPYDEEVEYLQSNGKQWIDTGCVPTATSVMSCKMALDDAVSTQLNGTTLHSGETNSRFAWGPNGNIGQIYFGVGSFNYTIGGKCDTSIHTWGIDFTTKSVSYDSNKYYPSFTIGNYLSNTYLFIRNYGTGDYPMKGKIYAFTMTGSKTLNLIPVIKNGIGYFYDKVSGTLLSNRGTGTFGYKKKDGTVVSPT